MSQIRVKTVSMLKFLILYTIKPIYTIFKAMHAGSFTAWSMESEWMEPWTHLELLKSLETIRSQPSSPKLEPVNMFHGLFLWILNQGKNMLPLLKTLRVL